MAVGGRRKGVQLWISGAARGMLAFEEGAGRHFVIGVRSVSFQVIVCVLLRGVDQ